MSRDKRGNRTHGQHRIEQFDPSRRHDALDAMMRNSNRRLRNPPCQAGTLLDPSTTASCLATDNDGAVGPGLGRARPW